MPSKKKAVLPDEHEAVLETETFEVPPAKEKVVKEARMVEPAACGHINRHHYGANGRLQELTCGLKPKHTGDHHAKYQRKIADPVTDEKGRVVKVEYREEEADGYWTDSAGKPAKDISEGSMPQLNLMQKDLLAQLMSRNPDMTVEVALERAKTDPRWNVPTALS